MTLRVFGTSLKISHVNSEIRRDDKLPLSLNSPEVRLIAGKPSGKISMSDLYGRSYKITASITFPAGTTTWTAPASTTLIQNASGYGARGTNASSSSYNYWYVSYTNYYMRRSDNFIETVPSGNSPQTVGSPPYTGTKCDPTYMMPDSTVYSSGQHCETMNTGTSTTNNPATTGASASAFGYNFLGSYTNVAQTTQSISNIAVNPGQTYSIFVPAGGTLTITYDYIPT